MRGCASPRPRSAMGYWRRAPAWPAPAAPRGTPSARGSPRTTAGRNSRQQRRRRPGRTRDARPWSGRLGLGLGAFLFLELLLRQLADRCLGQLGPDLQGDRHLVFADLALEMLLQFLEGERGAGLQLDEHLGRFLAVGIGNADDDAFVDRGMLV